MTRDRTGERRGAETLTARINFRVTEISRERAELAAAELEMDFPDYCRTIFEAAIDAHFDERQLRVVEVPSHTRPDESYRVTIDQDGGPVHCDCPGWARLGRCRHAEKIAAYGPGGPDPDTDESIDDYVARVEEAAAAERARVAAGGRVEHPGNPQVGDNPVDNQPPDPRTCPHLPQWRVGSRCRCGASLGGGGRIPLRTGRTR